jgi:hypothetical protein
MTAVFPLPGDQIRRAVEPSAADATFEQLDALGVAADRSLTAHRRIALTPLRRPPTISRPFASPLTGASKTPT